jgi:hypothetical protein
MAISGFRRPRRPNATVVGHVDTIVCARRNMSGGKIRAELYFAIVSGNPGGVGDVGGV